MFPTTEMHELVLVETIIGLCSLSHAPALRNQTISADSRIIDQIALDNMAGTLTQGAVQGYAPHISGFTTSPLSISTIRGGYDEFNKGLMKLKFRIGKENFVTEYMHVMGFLTNNEEVGGISLNAVFIPVCSWRERKSVTAGIGHNGQPIVSSMLSVRNDYMFNDGTLAQNIGWTTIRPGDVLNGISNTLDNQHIVDTLVENEGLDPNNVNVGSASASLALTSVISKRSNINPTTYSGELLSAVAKTANDYSSGPKNIYNGEAEEGDFYQSTAARVFTKETKSYDDPFLMTVLEGRSHAGYRGTQMMELEHFFPNLRETIPAGGFITLDQNRHNVSDLREISRLFGTSSLAETIAYELVFNILDVMTLHGLSVFHIIGSNCERQQAGYMRRENDDRMSNITVVPAHYVPLADNDVDINQRAEYASSDLVHQIMTKLNGMGHYVATPIKFELKSELFGMSILSMSLPTDENPNPGFVDFSFPTYAFSRFSPILTHIDGQKTMCDGVFKNLSSYLKNGFRH